MKNFSILLMITALLLVGCGNESKSDTESSTYTVAEKNDYVEIKTTYQLEHKEDEVVGMVVTNQYEGLKDNKTRDELLTQFDSKKELYKDEEGISITIDEKDQAFTATTNVDFEELDEEDYDKAIYNIDYYLEDGQLSLKKFDENLKEMGYKKE